MTNLEEAGLIYNWNKNNYKKGKQILDTSLRDGLQDPSISQPKLEDCFKLVKLMDEVGVDAADIGFPVNSKEHRDNVVEIAKFIKEDKLNIKVCVLARTQIPDIEAAIEVSQRAQVPVEAITIVGSSKVRHFVEKWDLNNIRKWIKESIQLAIKNNLQINFLTEDGTRTEPEIIKTLYSDAIAFGAELVTIADTVGFSTPEGTEKILKFLKDEVIKDKKIVLDWHGHNDRDLATANSLRAFTAGADRAHVTVLGIGERAGNSAMEPLLINMNMMGMANKNLTKLPELSKQASEMFNFPIGPNNPGIGKYVHTTSVGIHASAIMKARNDNREDLANTVYSGVDPQMLGLRTEIFVGPLSGKANVEYVLKKHKIETNEEMINYILRYTRKHNQVLKDEEVIKLAKAHHKNGNQIVE